MRGLQHNVIEINDTENTDIEKILIFLRPGQHKITVDNTRQDAAEILKKVKVRKRRKRMSRESKILTRAFIITIGMFIALLFLL